MEKVIISNKDKKKLPVFCNYVGYNVMISPDVEEKLFAYSEKKERMYGNHRSTRPISKIINTEKIT